MDIYISDPKFQTVQPGKEDKEKDFRNINLSHKEQCNSFKSDVI